VNITVVVTGYVGLVTGACFSEFGVHVTCVDKVKEKIDLLNKGKIPIYEPGLEEIVERNAKEERLFFSTDIKSAIENSLVIFIAVGTPQGETGMADLSFVKGVAQSIGKYINGYKVVVTKSTVPIGTGEMIKGVIKENMQGAHKFSMVSNPEFLREGSAIEDFLRPNRVVIGVEDAKSAAIMKDLYAPLSVQVSAISIQPEPGKYRLFC
jgi:UDPglucose 6-dehydrogenase